MVMKTDHDQPLIVLPFDVCVLLVFYSGPGGTWMPEALPVEPGPLSEPELAKLTAALEARRERKEAQHG